MPRAALQSLAGVLKNGGVDSGGKHWEDSIKSLIEGKTQKRALRLSTGCGAVEGQNFAMASV